MGLGSEVAAGSVSPLPRGEVGSPTGRRKAPPDDKLRGPGEGLGPIERPYPLTPTLSQSKSDISDFDNLRCPTRVNPSWVERGLTSVVAKASTSPLQCRDIAC